MFIISILKKIISLYKEKKLKASLGHCGYDSDILPPCMLGATPQKIYLDDYTLVQPRSNFVMAGGSVYIKKWSSLSFNCTIVTGNHKPTVGLNQRVIERYHINDVESDIVIGEDCWVGANVTILSGTYLRRGSVVGACSLLNKQYPPYAVLVGIPARIIGVKFTIDQIIEHEECLYPPQERLSKDELESIFAKYYKGMKSMGTDYISKEDLKTARQNVDMQFYI